MTGVRFSPGWQKKSGELLRYDCVSTLPRVLKNGGAKAV
jgi:hypothetical protein